MSLFCPTHAHRPYTEHKPRITTINEDGARRIAWMGGGVRSFALDIIDRLLTLGHRFISYDEAMATMAVQFRR